MQNSNIPFRTMIDLVEAANRIDGYADSPTEAYAPLDTKGIVGAFTEATRKKRFEYRNSTDPWGKSHGLPHEVCVSHGGDRKEQWRAANVKGTVCYIAVDEGADGKPVMEKWAIRNHVRYVKAESVESADSLTESLDAYLHGRDEEELWWRNITHNNARIANAVSPELYRTLWRNWSSPDVSAASLIPMLKSAIREIEGNKEKYLALDPTNKWGGTNDLLDFMRGLLKACLANPTAVYTSHG